MTHQSTYVVVHKGLLLLKPTKKKRNKKKKKKGKGYITLGFRVFGAFLS